MGKRIFRRWVGDLMIDVEIDRVAILNLGDDLDTASGDVAANIGLVGELIGDYTRLFAQKDAEYRNWKAATYLRFKLVDGKAPSDELVKNQVDGEPEFVTRKAELGELEGDLEYLRGLHEALRAKTTLINARVNLRRGKEYGESGGVDLRESGRAPAPVKTDAERAAAVKDKLNKAKEPK